MINVDDEIADLQVAKIGEKGPRQVSTLLRGTTLLLEDIGLGIHLETGLVEREASREIAASHQDSSCMRVLGPFDRNRNDVVVAKDLDGALRAAGAVR